MTPETSPCTLPYDAAGNQIATGGSWARSGLPEAVAATTYDAANQQLTFGPVTETFDANGNLLARTEGGTTTTYTWDARNPIRSRFVGPDPLLEALAGYGQAGISKGLVKSTRMKLCSPSPAGTPTPIR